ncbi:hypothetical protein [Kordia sp.]|uniref:hypothetical protein n=1 Tax=Kordia sp. TaxID=1965332 RepID=UPI0025C1FB10|nr:hypothetical protein [Kordia sp.]MCH2193622.1 hypothetical protein [Kordia sp.]
MSGIRYNFNPEQLNLLDTTSVINSRKLDDKFAFEVGIYAGLEYKISEKLTAQYGIRYSYFNRLV